MAILVLSTLTACANVLIAATPVPRRAHLVVAPLHEGTSLPAVVVNWVHRDGVPGIRRFRQSPGAISLRPGRYRAGLLCSRIVKDLTLGPHDFERKWMFTVEANGRYRLDCVDGGNGEPIFNLELQSGIL